ARVLSIVRVDVAAQDSDRFTKKRRLALPWSERIRPRGCRTDSTAVDLVHPGAAATSQDFTKGYPDLIISREARVRPGDLLGSGHRYAVNSRTGGRAP